MNSFKVCFAPEALADDKWLGERKKAGHFKLYNKEEEGWRVPIRATMNGHAKTSSETKLVREYYETSD